MLRKDDEKKNLFLFGEDIIGIISFLIFRELEFRRKAIEGVIVWSRIKSHIWWYKINELVFLEWVIE